MSIKIALIGARISTNLGGPSMLVSTIKVLNVFFKMLTIPHLSHVPPTKRIELSHPNIV